MKRLLVLLITVFSFAATVNAQVININGIDQILDPKEADDVSDDLKGIEYKKYLTKEYKAEFVDDFKVRAFLRYNIYEDQMEFVKDNNVYYLKKDIGRKIKFADKTTYLVYGLEGKPQFFLVHQEGKNMLLAKQVVRYVEAREPNSGYDRGTPADYRRRKDEIFIAFEGKGLVEVPRKKKTFYKIFGDHEAKIKSYMKENRLGYKNVDDLKQVVAYYNTL